MPSKPRIYLDSSALGRPFDDQSQPRIFRETQALIVIIGAIHDKSIELVSSDILEYEKNLSPDAARRKWVESVLTMAQMKLAITDGIEQRGRELHNLGLKAIDALHAASAEAARVSSLISCDDRFAKRYRGPVRIIRPERFVLDLISAP
ncbi:MAG TPA: PIN domain-containing protein [Tepidisphaeraceae bacterium]|jgi:predicted nucleic acid-binding protein|nr:PIN domain-containing protein [Tepidisphaeraceae bacterium]